MNPRALLTATCAGLAALAASTLAATPAAAAALPAGTAESVVSCGNSGLQAGLSTRVCAKTTGTTVEFYGTVGLAGPPSPGSLPPYKELFTTLSAQVAGDAAPRTQTKSVLFSSTTIEVHGLVGTIACGSTVRGTFGVSSYPWAANPVVHEVTVTC